MALVKSSKVKTFVESLYLAVLGVYIAYLIKGNAEYNTLIRYDQETLHTVLLWAVFAVSMISLVYQIISGRFTRDKVKPFLLTSAAICASYLAVYISSGYAEDCEHFLFLAILTVGAAGIDYRKILTVYFYVTLILVITTNLAAINGLITNLVYLKDGGPRSAWGFGYPTDYAAYLVYLCIAGWILFRKKRSVSFVLPALLAFVLSAYVAKSDTGVICIIAFIIAVIYEEYSDKIKNTKIKTYVDSFALCAFPFFSCLTIILVWAYKHGLPLTGAIDSALSGRIRLAAEAWSEYGLSLFGKPLEQVGWGGSTFAVTDYSYVDISYALILLKYGIVTLIVLNVIWVMMTSKALRTGNHRMALSMALIALHSASEQRFTEINYNILLLIAVTLLVFGEQFSTAPLTVKNKVAELMKRRSEVSLKLKGRRVEKKGISVNLFGVIALAGVLVFIGSIYPKMLSRMRTVIELSSTGAESDLADLSWKFPAFLGILAATVFTLLIYYIIRAEVRNLNERKKLNLAAVVIVVFFIMINMAAASRINGAIEEKMNTVENKAQFALDKDAVELINKSRHGNLFVWQLSEVYKKLYGGIKVSLFDGEELARYDNATVIVKNDFDSPCFINSGYLYSQISDIHSVYSKDEKVIEALEKEGYHFTGYFSGEGNVSMDTMAGYNRLPVNEDGSVTIKGGKSALRDGPYADLRAGTYTFSFRIGIKKSAKEKYEGEERACRIVVTGNRGKTVIADKTLHYEEFKKRNYTFKLQASLPDTAGVEFKVLPYDQKKFFVRNIKYKKDPDLDIHRSYDKKGRVIREEYFDMEGKPYQKQGGYYAKDFGYDRNSNINAEIFYGKDGERVTVENGVSEIRRKYNKSRQCIREEYYGTDGEPCINLWGFAAKDIERDEKGNAIAEIYYNAEGEKTLNTIGFGEIRREFNRENQIVRETYYDIDGVVTAQEAGQASSAYKYDKSGRLIELTYYDIHGNPVLIGGETWGGYYKEKRIYDKQGRMSYSYYYDIEGKPVKLKEGYASRQYIYDESNEIVGYKYYDAKGKEIEL